MNDEPEKDTEERLENFALWTALRNQKPNIPLLKEGG